MYLFCSRIYTRCKYTIREKIYFNVYTVYHSRYTRTFRSENNVFFFFEFCFSIKFTKYTRRRTTRSAAHEAR